MILCVWREMRDDSYWMKGRRFKDKTELTEYAREHGYSEVLVSLVVGEDVIRYPIIRRKA